MEVFLIKTGQLLLSLSILIILHEFGHYLPAKLFKTRVEKFYLFFDYKFSLFKKKIGDTVYGIGWIPLGGYVKISGMIDESMDKEQMALPPKSWEFRSKPAWQRLIIMIGGVTVNLIVGFVIYMMIAGVWGTDYVKSDGVKYGFGVTKTLKKYGFKNGDNIINVNGKVLDDVLDINKYLLVRKIETIEVKHTDGTNEILKLPKDIGNQLFINGDFPSLQPRHYFKIDSVIVDKNAHKFGLNKTDKIIGINNNKIEFWQDFTYHFKNRTSDTISLKILRDNLEKTINIPVKNNAIGISITSTDEKYFTINHRKYTFKESVKKGFSDAYWTLSDYASQMKYIFTKKGASSLGGFATIGKLFSPQWNWHSFWDKTAFISLVLAFMNILPIPALDGGHIMFTLYEMITGRKPSDNFLEHAQIFGFILLMSLLLYANGMDIYRAITGK